MVNWENRKQKYIETIRRGRTKETVRGIQNRINMLTRWMQSKELSYEIYEQWLQWAFENYSYTSVNRAHKEIKRFVKWLKLPAYYELEFLRIPEKLPKIKTLSKEQLQTVIDWSLKQTGVNWRRRCAIYLLLLATSGMRAGECIRLKWDNWDESTHTFHLEDTKTGVSRIAAYSPQLTPHLKQWREDYAREKASPSIWVIPSLMYPGHHAKYTAIQIKINTRLKHVFDFHFTSKMFRSTMVQRIIDSGGRYEEAAAVVGHKDIGVTQKHYARIKMNQRSIDAHSNALKDIEF